MDSDISIAILTCWYGPYPWYPHLSVYPKKNPSEFLQRDLPKTQLLYQLLFNSLAFAFQTGLSLTGSFYLVASKTEGKA